MAAVAPLAEGRATLNVPGQYGSIQAAINAASNGDTIVVAPGAYPGSVDFLGKGVTVISASGPATTLLDGMGAATVVHMVNGETAAATLDGFTITNGAGTASGLPGGAHFRQSTGTIRNCWFIANLGGYADAGAVLCEATAAPTFSDCRFEGNIGGDTMGPAEEAGPGAIRCRQGSPVLERCVFLGNRGGDGLDEHMGGGPGVVDCSSSSAPVLRDCVFDSNVGGDGVGADHSRGGAGVMAHSSNSFARLEDCVFRENAGGNGTGQGGAGAFETSGHCSPQTCTPPGLVVEGARFTDNRGGTGHDGGPGALCVRSGSTPRFSRCTFLGNRGGDTVAGIGSVAGPGVAMCTSSGSPTLLQCLMRRNQGGYAAAEEARIGGTGALFVTSGEPRLESCTLDENRGGRGGPGTFDRGGTGAILVNNGSGKVTLINCVVARNVGAGPGHIPGGGFLLGDRSGAGGVEVPGGGWVRATNCTFVLNEAGPTTTVGLVGGLLLNHHCQITNSIVWGNIGSGGIPDIDTSTNVHGDAASVDYCCLGSPYARPGVRNFVADPRLVDPSAGDYRLLCDSPCEDAGLDEAEDLPELDLDGDPRILGQRVDIGADESPSAALGTNYCIAAPNSSGTGALMSARGRSGIADNCLRLVANGLPGTPGLFFYGPSQLQVTFGNGIRCVGGAIRRLSPSPSHDGRLARSVDLTETQILPHSTWHFQAWYRDPAAGGARFNVSDGLTLTFGQ